MKPVPLRQGLLFALILALLVIRIILAFSVSEVTYDSYHTFRQIESIGNTGIPLYEDDLSFGGKINLFLPFFYYLMAGFALLLPKLLVQRFRL